MSDQKTPPKIPEPVPLLSWPSKVTAKSSASSPQSSTPMPPVDSSSEFSASSFAPSVSQQSAQTPSNSGQPAAIATAGDFRELRPINNIGMFFLLWFTGGLFSPFWMLRIAKDLNRIMPSRRMSPGLIWGLFAAPILLIAIGGTGYELSLATSPIGPMLMMGVYPFAGLVFIYQLFVVFTLQGRLNLLLQLDHSPVAKKFSPIWTFFFSVLYLNIRMNRLINERRNELGH